MPKLSIVTICFNDLAGLKATIASLSLQSVHDFEHHIVDGGSQDGTRDFLQNLKVDWPLSWSSEKDKGLYDAMNKGLSRADGEYIWFLNSGDICASSIVLEQILPHLNGEMDLVYGKAWYIGPHGKKSVGKKIKASAFHRGMPICHQATFYRTSLLRQTPYPIEFRIISDWIVTKGLFEKTALTKFVDIYITNFDLSGISASNHLEILKETLRSEKSLWTKAKLAFFFGGRFSLIWIFKKMGLYKAVKKIQLGRGSITRNS